jgi:ornithine cyclodeaminase/alanine dehydrogenase-like protein (mu-crystallin family)
MDDAIGAVEAAFRALGQGSAQNRPRARVYVPSGVLNVMSAALPDAGVLGLKSYTAFREGVRFLVLLYSAEDGRLLAVIEADRLGQMRTGAASGVATRLLARADATSVGLIGAGWQAQSQLAAVCAVRPIRSVRVFSRREAKGKAFAEAMSARLGVRIMPAASAEDAVRGADVVIAATTAREPVVAGDWLRPGQHINAVGSNQAARRELDSAAVDRCDRIIIDSLEQGRMEAGDVLMPINEGRFGWERVAELAHVLVGRAPGRSSRDEITLFKSLGLAIEDMAVAARVYTRALAERRGERLPF